MWLNKALYLVKVALIVAPLVAPFSASAGVFSFFSNFLGNKEADAGSSVRTSEVVGVLQAQVGPAFLASVDGIEIALADDSALVAEAGVNGTMADVFGTSKTTQISLYVVRKGDTLSQIADMYGVTVNTIVWANNLKGSIHEGDELVILPISGVIHKVAKGDTLKSIATKYRADVDDILSFNDMSADETLSIGTSIIIPDGEIAAPKTIPGAAANPTEPLRNAGGPVYKNYYLRPIDGGVKSQGLHGYNGVDLAAPVGTPIHAAASGTAIVVRNAGYNGGYGTYVVISHDNGTQTLYAHMRETAVVQGASVTQGDVIGYIGMTGKTTGPHVHFEIRGATNPF